MKTKQTRRKSPQVDQPPGGYDSIVPNIDTKVGNEADKGLILSFEDIMLIYEDPYVYKLISKGIEKREVLEEEKMTNLILDLSISKEKANERFAVVDKVPESSVLLRYMEALSNNISKCMDLNDEIKEDDYEQAKVRAYEDCNIKSITIDQLDTEASEFREYFNYLNNRDSKVLIDKTIYDRFLSAINSIPEGFISSSKIGDNADKLDGVTTTGLKIKLQKGIAKQFYFDITFRPFAINMYKDSGAIAIAKFTNDRIVNFKDTFKRLKYDLELAHCSIAIKNLYPNIDPKDIDMFIYVFDKYGRYESFETKRSTITQAENDYIEILDCVNKNVSNNSWEKPARKNCDHKVL